MGPTTELESLILNRPSWIHFPPFSFPTPNNSTGQNHANHTTEPPSPRLKRVNGGFFLRRGALSFHFITSPARYEFQAPTHRNPSIKNVRTCDTSSAIEAIYSAAECGGIFLSAPTNISTSYLYATLIVRTVRCGAVPEAARTLRDRCHLDTIWAQSAVCTLHSALCILHALPSRLYKYQPAYTRR